MVLALIIFPRLSVPGNSGGFAHRLALLLLGAASDLMDCVWVLASSIGICTIDGAV